MASAFAHGLTAFTFRYIAGAKKTERRLLLLGILSAIFPDADVIAFDLGIPYEHPLGHRGFTHSLFFALLWSVGLVGIARKFRWIQSGWLFSSAYLFLCSASHGILDAMTTGGRGIAFFWPFNSDRFFLPWRVIQVSPVSVDAFFSEWGLRVIYSELIYIGLPCLVIIILGEVLNRKL